MEKNYTPELSIRTVKMGGNVVITQLSFGQIQLMLAVVTMSARQDLNKKYTVLGIKQNRTLGRPCTTRTLYFTL